MVAKKSYVSQELLVDKSNFIPAPNVQSSVLLFTSHQKFRDIDDKLFMKYIKI
jgi:16S rRNA A1518/A1519 N6-dimethyltransferase RsmA/KsgA/DIM1 with predicted DNA glycosylase/AP lyase activity